MGLLDNIPEVGNIINVGSRIMELLNKMLENTDIKEHFKQTGIINAGFNVYDYSVKFTIEDKRKTTINAEVQDVQ